MDFFENAMTHIPSNAACSKLTGTFVKSIGALSLWREIDTIAHRQVAANYRKACVAESSQNVMPET
jgi:hypothetical protein